MKKILFSLFSVFFIFSYVIGFSSASNKYLDSANELAFMWIINNHSENPSNYNLDSNVLRQEIAAVSRWVASLEKKWKCTNVFNDVSENIPNNWACFSIEALSDNNIIAKNQNFRPEDNITKSESLWMLIKSIWFDYTYDESISKSWQEQIVEYSYNKWILSEKFTDYDSLATRWWIFYIADTIIKKDQDEKDLSIILNIFSELDLD